MSVGPLPPTNLSGRSPNTIDLVPGQIVHRFYTASFDPIYFDKTDAGRLNAPDGTYGVLYAAKHPAGAFAETFLRTPGRQLIDPGLMAVKGFVRLEVLKPATLIDFDGPGLAILGATAEVVHGSPPYDLPQKWSAALKAHPSKPDGIAYGARHDPSQLCYALFESASVREIDRQNDLDANWFWSLADVYKVGRPPS